MVPVGLIEKHAQGRKLSLSVYILGIEMKYVSADLCEMTKSFVMFQIDENSRLCLLPIMILVCENAVFILYLD